MAHADSDQGRIERPSDRRGTERRVADTPVATDRRDGERRTGRDRRDN